MLRSWCLGILMLLSVSADAATVLVLGDSISAAYGMETEQGWVSLLQRRLQHEGYPHQVVNASISGETTSGGRTRLNGLLARYRPEVVVIELGGNDGLRGTPLAAIEANLDALVGQSLGDGAAVALLGMRIPPNYGPRYSAGFQRLFVTVGAKHRIAVLPFFLRGVAGNPALMQADGIHPRAEAQGRLLEQAWPLLQPLLDSRPAPHS